MFRKPCFASLARLMLFGLACVSVAAHAQTVPAAPTPAPSAAPQLVITDYDNVSFSQPSKLNLQAWRIQSNGVGAVEVYVWYIVGGKAFLRDQRLLSWRQKQQRGTWRLMLMAQGLTSSTLPSLGLQTVFDVKNDGPNASAIGISPGARQTPPPLPSPFFMHFVTTTTDASGVLPNRTILLYADEAHKNGKANRSGSPFALVRDKNPKPIEALTQSSRTPDTAFLLLTLRWKPPQPAPKP